MYIGFVQLSSCIKPTNNDPITETTPGAKVIDKTITNSMYFKVGSYWIYENDKGELDSMWVDIKSSIGFDRNSKAQYFNTYLYSSIEQNSRVISVEFEKFEPDTQIRIQVLNYYRGSQNGIISADIFKQGKESTNTCLTCKGDTAILMPTYTVKGKEYKNVWRLVTKKYRDIFNNDSDPNSGEYYFAENIGIVDKSEGGAPHFSKLIRCHIEK